MSPRQQSGYIPGQGLPLGSPFGSSNDPVLPQVSGPETESRPTNTGWSSSPDKHLIRVGARQLERLRLNLADRDQAILLGLGQHRYLTTHQVQAFYFTSHASPATAARSTRRVLSRLASSGLATSIERRVGGVRAGSSATVWALTAAGRRLLADSGLRVATREPSPRFLAHCLGVADVHLLLLAHAEVEPVESVTVQLEPVCWRAYPGLGGERRLLQPDLYGELATAEFVDRYFIEVDMGTESLPTLIGKCQQYQAYRASGIEQADRGRFPLVLWLLPDYRRARRLQAAIRGSRQLNPAMFLQATPLTLAQTLAGGGS